jgi:hypothetical protein
MHFDYARNSYHDEFSDFPPRSYSCASPRTSSHALPHFSHGPKHRSYSFGSRENNFVPRRIGYSPRPHRGDHFLLRPSFPAGGSQTHFESKYLDGPYFPRCGLRPTGSNNEVLKTVKTFSGYIVKCWIPKIYLTNPSIEPLTSSRPMQVLDGRLEDKWLMDSGCSRHMTGDKKWFFCLTSLSQGVCDFWG